MKNNASILFSLVLVVGDFLALLAAFVLAYVLRVQFDPRPLIEQIPVLTYVYGFMVILPFWIVVNAFLGLYNKNVYEKRFSELGRLLLGSFLGILVIIGYDFVVSGALFPARLVPVYGLVIGFGFLVLFRSVARLVRRLLFKHNIGISNVLIVGNTRASESIVNAIHDSKNTGQKVLAVVGKNIPTYQYYETFTDALQHLRRPIHSIIQTELYRQQDKNNEILTYAQQNHASYRFIPGNSDLFVGKIDVELFADLPVIAVHQTALVGWGRIAKRIFDIVVSLCIVIVLSPLFLLISLLIFLFDPGDIFFRQTRITRYNITFRMFKFRTAKKKYNKLTPEEAFAKMGKPELAKQYRKNGDQVPNDPRYTKIGHFLRKFSLDELPQFFNVIKGDISLVGPRALVPEELNASELKHHILSVKTGITGLAQISGRKDISFEERRKLDVYYVQNWSFWLDIVILFKTIKVVLTRRGAQ